MKLHSWGPVTSVAWSRDGKVVYAGRNGEVWSYSAKTGECLRRDRVSSTDRVSGIWPSQETGHYIAWTRNEVIEMPQNKIHSLKDRVLAASENKYVLATSGEVRLLRDDEKLFGKLRRGKLGELRCAALKDEVYAGGDARGRVATHDTEREDAHNGAVCTSLAYCQARQHLLLSTCEDRGVRCFNANLEVLWLGLGHTARAWQVRGNEHRVYSVSQDATVCVWNSSGKLLQVLRGHAGKHTWALAVHGNTVASGGQDATLRLWTVSDQEKHLPLPEKYHETTKKNAISAMALTASGSFLVVLSNCGSVLEYSDHSTRLVFQGTHVTVGASYLELDDARIVVCGSRGGWLSVLRKCEEHDSFTALSWRAAATRALRAFFLPEDLLAVTTGDDTSLRFFRNDSSAGEFLSRFQVTALCGDGTLLYLGDSRGGVTLIKKSHESWTSTWRVCPPIQRQAVVCCFEAADNILSMAMRDGSVCDLDKETGALAAGPRRPSKSLMRVTSCRGLVLCGWDAEQRLTAVDANSGRLLLQLSVANKTGKQLVNAMRLEDDTVRIAQVLDNVIQSATSIYNPKRTELGSPLVADGVAAAAWLDENRLMLAGGSGQLAIYQLNNGTLILERWLQSSIHAERAMVSCYHGGVACVSEHEVREFSGRGFPLRLTRFKSKEDASDQRVRALVLIGEDQYALGDSAGVLRLISHGKLCCECAYDASPILCMSSCPGLKLAHGTSTGILVLWQLAVALDSTQVVLVLGLHTAGVMSMVSLPGDTLNLVTGGDDHVLSTFDGVCLETIPLARPAPVIGLAASVRYVYAVTADHRLSQWRRKITADSSPMWHKAPSQHEARSLVLIAERFLDLARPNGLTIAPSSDSTEDDTLIVYGDGGLCIISSFSSSEGELR